MLVTMRRMVRPGSDKVSGVLPYQVEIRRQVVLPIVPRIGDTIHYADRDSVEVVSVDLFEGARVVNVWTDTMVVSKPEDVTKVADMMVKEYGWHLFDPYAE